MNLMTTIFLYTIGMIPLVILAIGDAFLIKRKKVGRNPGLYTLFLAISVLVCVIYAVWMVSRITPLIQSLY